MAARLRRLYAAKRVVALLLKRSNVSRRKKEDNTSRTQIIIAVIGLVGVMATALIANLDKWWPASNMNQNTNGNISQRPAPTPQENSNSSSKSQTIAPLTKVIAIMDNNLLTYDKESRREARTNHNDIEDTLKGLDLKFVPINTNLRWNDYAALWEAKPDLIIIHVSAFYDKTDPNDTDDRFRIFLHNAMPKLPDTKLLVYSRAFAAVTTSEIERYAASVLSLKERTSFFKVEPGPSRKYFNDKQISNSLKDKVKQILSL